MLVYTFPGVHYLIWLNYITKSSVINMYVMLSTLCLRFYTVVVYMHINLHEINVHCIIQDFTNQVHYYLAGKVLL
jgi:hypothetical protein